MSDDDWGVDPQNLSAPPFIGPNDPGIIFGVDPIPPELITYYNGLGYTIVSFLEFRNNGTRYNYLANIYLTATPAAGFYISTGVVVIGSGVFELMRTGLKSAFPTVEMMFALDIDIGCTYTIDTVSQGRGLLPLCFLASQANSAPVGAEQQLFGISATFRSGRAFATHYAAETTGSIANNTAQYIVRKTNTAGPILSFSAHKMSAAVGTSEHCEASAIFINTGIDQVATLVLDLAGLGGGTVTSTGSAIVARYFEVSDIGAASDYAGAITL